MRPLPLALAVSIVLNLFLAGALIGGAVWLRAHRPGIAAGALRVAGAELPRAERMALRATLREARAASSESITAGRRARMRAATLLRAPMLDQPALLGALAEARAADMTVRGAVEARAVTFIATLPAADRGRMADAMARRAHGGRPLP